MSSVDELYIDIYIPHINKMGYMFIMKYYSL